MSPRHADEDCAGVWQHDHRNKTFICSRCKVVYEITPEVWAEVQDELAHHYRLILEAKEGRRILEYERGEGDT